MSDRVDYGRVGESIVIYREHFLRLLAFPKPIREQVILELPCEIGLRTGEIATLLIENIDLESGDIIIRDSKNYRLYPLTLTFQLAKHIEQLIGTLDTTEGYLIRQLPSSGKVSDKPMHTTSIWYRWRNWAKLAKLPNWKQYTPRFGRHYFAATWAYIKKGNLEILRRIMRHKDLTYTQIYLSRLIFYEDVKREVERLQNLPISKQTMEGCERSEICRFYVAAESGGCIHQAICKHYRARGEVQTA